MSNKLQNKSKNFTEKWSLVASKKPFVYENELRVISIEF